jgi:hypothetical protein
MELTAEDIAAIPPRNLHVPREQFVTVWIAAERYVSEHPTDWYGAGVAVACRWLANATVRPKTGAWYKQWAPVTEREASAYEELIEAECLAAETMLMRRPASTWILNRPGWVEAISTTLNWAWRRTGIAPIGIQPSAHI